MRTIRLASLLALVVAACAPGPTPSPARPSAVPSPAVRLQTPSPAIVSPSPALAADLAISPDIQIVYTNENVGMWASAFVISDKTAATAAIHIATATIDFGDGATGSVSQSCTAPAPRLRLHHVYTTAADYRLTVSAAILCEAGWQLNLDPGEGIRILPAAPPDTAAWPLCTTYQLKMTDGGTGAGLGNVGTLVHLINVSSSGCNLEGYPGLRLVSASGALLPTHVQHATEGAYMYASMAVGRVALAPGDIASLELAYSDNPFGSAVNEPYTIACPPAKWLRVILPGNSQYGTARLATAPCSGIVSVSPIYPGGGWIGFP
jgi:hypothetical protein